VQFARLAGDAVWFVRWGLGNNNELHRWRLDERESRIVGRHDGGIVDLDVTADGARAVTAAGATLRLWDAAGDAPQVLTGHLGRVTAVHLARHGDAVFSTGSDGTLRQWALADGSSRVLERYGDGLVALARADDDRVIVAAAGDGTILFVEPDGRARGSYRAHDRRGVNALAVSGDGRFIASLGDDRRLALYDRRPGTLQVLAPHTTPGDAVAFSPDSRRLASAGRDGNVVVRELESGSERVLRGHEFTTVVQFSPDGRHLASSGADRTTRLWDLGGDGAEVWGSTGQRVWSEVFARDGTSLATVAANGEVSVWRENLRLILGRHEGFALRAGFAGNGAWLATVAPSSPDGARLWDVVRGVGRVVGSGPAFDLDVAPDGALVAFAGADGVIRLVAPDAGDVRELRGHRGAVRSVRFSPDGRLLASGGSDGSVRLWQRDGTALHVLKGHSGGVHLLRFTSDGQALISASLLDHAVRRWRLEDGRMISLPAPPFPLLTLEISPDGEWLAGGGQGPFVRMWHLGTSEVRDLYGHSEQVAAVSFTPDSRLMATGSWDRTVRIWSVATGLPVAILRHESCVMDCRFAPSGQLLAVPTADRLLVTWRAPFDRGLPVAPDALADWLAHATRARIDEAGSLANPQ
jgi:WD40 repeat protein